jgi:hypothetical protein
MTKDIVVSSLGVDCPAKSKLNAKAKITLKYSLLQIT